MADLIDYLLVGGWFTPMRWLIWYRHCSAVWDCHLDFYLEPWVVGWWDFPRIAEGLPSYMSSRNNVKPLSFSLELGKLLSDVPLCPDFSPF